MSLRHLLAPASKGGEQCCPRQGFPYAEQPLVNRPLRFPGTIITTLSLSVAIAACGDSVRVVDAGDPARTTVLPGGPIPAITAAADGSGFLFVANAHTLFMAAPAESLQWEPVAELPFFPISMYAASPQEVFFIEQASPDVWTWRATDGFSHVASAARDTGGGHFMQIQPWALAGDGDSGVYAVGLRGTVLRLFENRVTIESTPVEAIAMQPAPAVYASSIWRVDSFGGRVYAATNSHLMERTSTGWHVIDLPETALAHLPITAIAADGSGVLVSLHSGRGTPRLFRYTNRGWKDLSHKLQGVDRALVGGRAQPDGSALFWAMARYVVEVRGERVRIFDVRGLGAVRGAVRRGRDVIAGGTREATFGIVVTLTR